MQNEIQEHLQESKRKKKRERLGAKQQIGDDSQPIVTKYQRENHTAQKSAHYFDKTLRIKHKLCQSISP